MAKAGLRDKLIEMGLETVHKNGFGATGVQVIVDAADVPKGSFYNYFDSKEAFGVEVLNLYFKGFGPRLQLLTDPSKSPVQRLKAYFESLGKTLGQWEYEKGCLIGNLSAELSSKNELIRERLAEVYEGWTSRIEACVREGQEQGEISRELKASVIASYLLNAWEGVALRTKVDKDKTAITQFMAVTFKTVLR
ncbi:TetR family transcriptional regulator C-terminal domain-containing protein [Bradyrhizobium sp. Pear76]|uniref:TetR/AcrR family transcriptional regulator n=1 Tax=Bradyrhizobium oropedii TaxID=1571201 RepID=UPI00237BF19E|nr:TetR/AcrR family transcriptional regulator [Bradyrhizobium oropedii]MCC8960774.1 TetR family transcriptional regulator C-terminal domain-containing protein [Bradyrhizobium oropedii]